MTRATLALLRKDAVWLLPALALGAGVELLMLYNRGFERTFVIPLGIGEEVVAAPAVLAIALGAFAALGERLGRTQDFLLHRPVSAAHVFWTRMSACALVVPAWVAIAVALALLHESVFGLGIECVDPGKLGDLGTTIALAELFFALTVLACLLPVRAAWRIALLAPVLIGGYLLFLMARIHALQAAVWIGLLVVAFVAFRGSDDPDRAVPRVSVFACAGFGLVAVFLSGVASLEDLERSALIEVAHDCPRIVRVAPEELALISPADLLGKMGVFVSPGSTSRFVEGPPVIGPPWPARSLEAPRHLTNATELLSTSEGDRWVTAMLGTDVVRVVDVSRDACRCWSLHHPEGKSWSEDTFDMGIESEFDADSRRFVLMGIPAHDTTAAVLVDPDTGGIWRVGTEIPPRLEPHPLPGGDAPVRWNARQLIDHRFEHVVEGRNGVWLPTADGWEPAQLAPRDELTRTILDGDALTPEVEVRTATGATLRHRYSLTTPAQHVFAGLAMVAASLVPPPTAIASALRAPETPPTETVDAPWWLFDPLIARGHRWLIVPDLTIAALVAFVCGWRMRRRGASLPRALFWMLGLAATGACGLPVFLAFESKRAWRRAADVGRDWMLIRAA